MTDNLISLIQLELPMTKQEFVNAVISIYKNARLILLPNNILASEKVRRGRNHVISGLIEDLLAYFLIEHFQQIDKITVDQALTIPNRKGSSKTIYPDLLLIIDGQIRAIIDVKTDLGMKRAELEKMLVNASSTIESLRGQALFYKDGITKERFSTSVTKDIKWFIVVISRMNITKQQVDTHLLNIKANRNIRHTKVYFLTDDIHPNRAIYEGKTDKIRILEEFEDFICDIRSLLS